MCGGVEVGTGAALGSRGGVSGVVLLELFKAGESGDVLLEPVRVDVVAALMRDDIDVAVSLGEGGGECLSSPGWTFPEARVAWERMSTGGEYCVLASTIRLTPDAVCNAEAGVLLPDLV